MLVCFFNSLHNGEHSNLIIVAAFSNYPFSYKTSLPVKNSYLLIFYCDWAEIFAICLSKMYWAFFCSMLLSAISIFLLTVILW